MRKYLTVNALPLFLLLIPILYLLTLAHTLVLGDPTEYTFVSNILGIAHPPGYAFITLLGKLFQTIIPFGEIPWRMHLLSATAATIAALFIYCIVNTTSRLAVKSVKTRILLVFGSLSALFAALTVATGVDYWQHAIHANPHIITAAFLAANLFFLTRWYASWKVDSEATADENNDRSNRWLYALSLSAGLGVTHHPLTVFAFPAYAIFILVVRPRILLDWRTLLKMIGFAILGLAAWLYLPLRSSMDPPFGPNTMNTLDGFLDHVLGRGITEALPYYSLVEQPQRLLVFWSILRLQYALPIIFLAVLALFWPLIERWTNRGRPSPAGNEEQIHAPGSLLLLYALAFLCNYAFVISLKAQDIMAYILGPLLIVGLLAGIGLFVLLSYLRQGLQFGKTWLLLLAAAIFLLGPVLQIVRNYSRISLRNYNEGDAYVEEVFSHFAGQDQGAVLLNDWEHMTPLWYTQFVENRWPDPSAVRPVYVSTARSWLDNVFDYLPGGPVYLSNYRRELVDAGFRLRPSGPFYQVVEPGNKELPSELTPISASWQDIEIEGYELPQTAISAGQYIPLTLAMRSQVGTEEFYVPEISVGDLTFTFTTDSHLVTPEWQPGEIVIERFDFALPHPLPAGSYPISVRLKNLSTNESSGELIDLGTLDVTGVSFPISTDGLLANFRQRVGLEWARAGSGIRQASAPWTEPISVQPGDTIAVVLGWKSLDYAEQSYTVFVHLIDAANRPIVALDYTPLGGAAPTHLWIPKWLPGQRYIDPYRLTIPENLPPGTYLIEAGLYEMVGGRRLNIADQNGNLVGDRYILGSVSVN
ncbi:MAG: DUF2723 domain-containing protein [Candidatus Promineifilaceae bacterium]|nr:DUF2723 domain-containing protein [Candidatus Promineifilaceae bacterium]